jgi:hypothetical protein
MLVYQSVIKYGGVSGNLVGCDRTPHKKLGNCWKINIMVI